MLKQVFRYEFSAIPKESSKAPAFHWTWVSCYDFTDSNRVSQYASDSLNALLKHSSFTHMDYKPVTWDRIEEPIFIK